MKKIIIIDDELEILDVLSRYLSREYMIETFNNPLDAIDAIKKESCDLVLSDIMMPQADGFEIVKEIKQIQARTKVVLMTAYNNEEKTKNAQELNVDGFIEKPFKNLNEVKNKIASLI